VGVGVFGFGGCFVVCGGGGWWLLGSALILSSRSFIGVSLNEESQRKKRREKEGRERRGRNKTNVRSTMGLDYVTRPEKNFKELQKSEPRQPEKDAKGKFSNSYHPENPVEKYRCTGEDHNEWRGT